MTALERLPPWSTTGVGSVPHATASAAAAHAVAAYDVPFCPQLPALDGDMVAQWLDADPAGCGWSPDRDAARPRAFGGFVAELRAHPPRHRVVKLRVTGPVTLAVALEREAGRRPEIAPVAALAVELSTWLAANTAALVEDLRALGLDVVLLADEPALATCGVAELARVWDPLRALTVVWGLHVCCAVPWDVIEHAEPELAYALSRIARRQRAEGRSPAPR